MKILDISTPLTNDTLVYPGDPKMLIRSKVKSGSVVSRASFGLHCGTHVDSPSHYIPGGKTVFELGLDRLNGPARVCDFTEVWWEITADDIGGEKIRRGDIALFRTRNSKLMQRNEFRRDYTSLSAEAAECLVRKKVPAVGIDYISIEKIGSSRVHKILLQEEIPIIESLDLSLAKAGRYRLTCMPLKFLGTEASPARCVLSPL
ncbi:MAG: cyclase family protein [Candidatus Altiarchaeota archaeon]